MKRPKEKQWFTVWQGPLIDKVFETLIRAKKHAAWLHHTLGRPTWWGEVVTLTSNGYVDIPFDDYEFRDGDSQKIKV